jgi:hypothetical protein
MIFESRVSSTVGSFTFLRLFVAPLLSEEDADLFDEFDLLDDVDAFDEVDDVDVGVRGLGPEY